VQRAAPDSQRTCALHDDGRVSCWGRGVVGGGNKPLEVVTSKPRTVQDLPPAVDVAAGGELACALIAAGEVYCWGAWPWTKTPAEQQTPRRGRVFGGRWGRV
jgi:alpha-tubulin suppressor-like RCC1 family protein